MLHNDTAFGQRKSNIELDSFVTRLTVLTIVKFVNE